MRFFTLLDLKSIGAVKWVTAALDLSVTAAVFLLFPGKRGAWIILELLFPYTTVLCGIFVLGNLWQRSSLTEMLAACNQGFHKILMVKYLIFIFFFAIAHMLEAALLCLQDGRSDGIWFVLLLGGECLLFGGVAFCLTVFMRDAGWTAIILPCIIAGDYGSGGRLFGSFHVALYWYEALSFSMVERRLIRAGALTVFFFAVGYAGIRKAYKNQKTKRR